MNAGHWTNDGLRRLLGLTTALVIATWSAVACAQAIASLTGRPGEVSVLADAPHALPLTHAPALAQVTGRFSVAWRQPSGRTVLATDRFGIEPELTIKVARRQVRIYETPISYHGRTYEEGKKITWRDGLWALYCIFRYNLAP